MLDRIPVQPLVTRQPSGGGLGILPSMSDRGTVWLVSQYEPPAGGGWRPLRSLYLGQALVRRGFKVIQWSATFSHQKRAFQAQPWEEREVQPGFIVRFVPNSSYQSNVGPARLRSEARYAREFFNKAQSEPHPTCMVVREPPAITGLMARRLAEAWSVPFVSDIIDLWPEFFHRVLPQRVRGAGKALFAPWYARRRKVWASANGIVGVSRAYELHALKEAKVLHERCHACVYSSIDVDFVQAKITSPSEVVDGFLGAKPQDEVWVAYAGTLGAAYEVPAIIQATRLLRDRNPKVKFVFAGPGPYADAIKDLAAEPGSNVTYLGQLTPDDLYPMLGRCDIGLCSYAADTTVAIPDKFWDYTAAGLPIVNSLQGEVKDLSAAHGHAVTYTSGSPESMADAIEVLAESPDKRQSMSERAVKAARGWDARTQSDLYVDLIEEVIHRGR